MKQNLVNWTTYSLCRDVYWDRNSEGRGSTIGKFCFKCRKIIRLPYTDFTKLKSSQSIAWRSKRLLLCLVKMLLIFTFYFIMSILVEVCIFYWSILRTNTAFVDFLCYMFDFHFTEFFPNIFAENSILLH